MKRVCSQQISQNRCESFTKFVYYTPMLTETAYSILRIVTILKSESHTVIWGIIRIKEINNKYTMRGNGKGKGVWWDRYAGGYCGKLSTPKCLNPATVCANIHCLQYGVIFPCLMYEYTSLIIKWNI